MSRNLIFCDIESSGLNEAKEHILEVALVAVDLPSLDVVAKASWVVIPPLWQTVKRNMHERALIMHTDNGLVAEIERGEGLSLATVERAAVEFVQQHAPKTPSWHTPLAGAGPQFDRKFLEKHMRSLASMFHYRNYDVRSLTQLAEWILGVPFQESPHRALPDALKAVADVREFLGLAPSAES